MTSQSGKNGKESENEVISYVLGHLTPEEFDQFEKRILGGEIDPASIAELLELSETLTALLEQIASRMPKPRRALKDEVLAAITEHSRDYIIRAKEGSWEESGFPGVTLKLLHRNESTARSTVLVRIAAGARYPEHRHVGYEECLVLEGSLMLDNTLLHAGDFIYTPNDKEHHDTHSDTGCLLLLTTQLEDEVLE